MRRHLSKMVGGGWRGWVEIPVVLGEWSRTYDGPRRRFAWIARVDSWRIRRALRRVGVDA